MELLTLFGIAIALSFDTFAVSLSYGAVEYRVKFRSALVVAVILALFQSGFAVAGYYMGATVSLWLSSFDHWIAMGLLTVLGVRMIHNATKPPGKTRKSDLATPAGLLTAAVSTSMDALAVGLSFAFILQINIWLVGMAIAFVTFMAAMVAIRIGKFAGLKAGPRAELAGGILLIAIGIQIVAAHFIA